MATLLQRLRYAKDAAGHEHKGAGPGGGQFVAGGGSDEKEPEKPAEQPKAEEPAPNTLAAKLRARASKLKAAPKVIGNRNPTGSFAGSELSQLAALGYKLDMGAHDLATKTTSYPVTDKDGNRTVMTTDEIKALLKGFWNPSEDDKRLIDRLAFGEATEEEVRDAQEWIANPTTNKDKRKTLGRAIRMGGYKQTTDKEFAAKMAAHKYATIGDRLRYAMTRQRYEPMTVIPGGENTFVRAYGNVKSRLKKRRRCKNKKAMLC